MEGANDSRQKLLFAAAAERDFEAPRFDLAFRADMAENPAQVRGPLTSDELRFGSSGEKGWRMELQTTGKLVFAIKTYLLQARVALEDRRRDFDEARPHSSIGWKTPAAPNVLEDINRQIPVASG